VYAEECEISSIAAIVSTFYSSNLCVVNEGLAPTSWLGNPEHEPLCGGKAGASGALCEHATLEPKLLDGT
jgi:hypothetical protein